MVYPTALAKSSTHQAYGLLRTRRALASGDMPRDTSQALEAKNQVMKNAVHGSLAFGDPRIAGAQTKMANRLTIPASTNAAKRGKMEKRTARPQPICPAPVR